MTSITELKTALLDDTIGLTTILRSAMVLAYQLNEPTFKQWIELEINGYTGDVPVPNYRKAKPSNQGSFSGMFGASASDFPLATSHLTQVVKDFAEQDSIRQKIAVIESLLAGGENEFGTNWPQEYVNAVSGEFLQDMRLISAIRITPKSTFVNIVEAVRTQLLTLILELEAKYPSINEDDPSDEIVSKAEVQTIVNQHIYGDGNAVAAGNSVTQTATVTVIENDADSLLEYLKSQGIDEAVALELKAAVVEDGERTPEQGFGSRTVAAMGNISKHALEGAWSVAKSTAASTVAKAIAMYYGWPG